MNPNTEYERFTQEVYRLLGQAIGVNAADVKHNVRLEGRSGQKHQIDVYWEYEKDGKTHRVAIECKNYSRRISLEKVCAFKGVLDDLDGVSGIMVTKVGFQKGAKKYAQQYGISLKELRSPQYGETIIGRVNLTMHLHMRHTLFLVDDDWVEEKGINLTGYRRFFNDLWLKNNGNRTQSPHIPLQIDDDIIRDSKGKAISSLHEMEDQLPDTQLGSDSITFPFDDAYVNVRGVGLVKIKEVRFEYENKEEENQIDLDAGSLVKAILKDAQSNETDFVSLV